MAVCECNFWNQPDMTDDDLKGRDETWKIRFDGEKVWFSRWVDGRADEQYRPLTLGEGAIAAAAIFQGFQPPHSLKRLDIPVRQTEPE